MCHVLPVLSGYLVANWHEMSVYLLGRSGSRRRGIFWVSGSRQGGKQLRGGHQGGGGHQGHQGDGGHQGHQGGGPHQVTKVTKVTKDALPTLARSTDFWSN